MVGDKDTVIEECNLTECNKVPKWQKKACVTEKRNCILQRMALGYSYGDDYNTVIGCVPVTASWDVWLLAGFEAKVKLPFQQECGADFDDTIMSYFNNKEAKEEIIKRQTWDDANFFNRAGPWFDAGLDVSAGVGNSNLFAVGVGGEASVMEADCFATSWVTGLGYDFQNKDIFGKVHIDVTKTLQGPNGSLYAYLGYPCVKVCRKWGVPYPCGTKQCRETFPFFDFELFEKDTDVLFCYEQGNPTPTP